MKYRTITGKDAVPFIICENNRSFQLWDELFFQKYPMHKKTSRFIVLILSDSLIEALLTKCYDEGMERALMDTLNSANTIYL